jgi:hypothetical protein
MIGMESKISYFIIRKVEVCKNFVVSLLTQLVPQLPCKDKFSKSQNPKGSLKTGVRAYARTPVFRYFFNFRDLLKLNTAAYSTNELLWKRFAIPANEYVSFFPYKYVVFSAYTNLILIKCYGKCGSSCLWVR